MDLSPFVDTVRRDLLQAAALGDDATRRTAAALASSIEPSVRLALMTALSQLAAEITGGLQADEHDHGAGPTVDVRLEGNEVKVSISRPTVSHADDEEGTASASASAIADGSWSQAMKDAGTELSRTTVRLFQDLKNQAEVAASDQGVSLNTYITRAVADSVRSKDSAKQPPRSRSHRTTTGWIST